METTFAFEDPGEGIHEAEVSKVLVAEGDRVEEGQDVIVVETDKTSFELASPRAGTVADVVVSEGDRVQVGDPLLHYQNGQESEADSDATDAGKRQAAGTDEADEQQSAQPEGADEQQSAQPKEGADEPRSAQPDGADEGKATRPDEAERGKSAAAEGGREDQATQARPKSEPGTETDDGASEGSRPVRATPATRKLARELKVDLHDVQPSGEHGRVLKSDVRAHQQGGDAETSDQGRRSDAPVAERRQAKSPRDDEADERDEFGPVRTRTLRSVRKRTAERMAESWRQVARVTHQDDADITELERLRSRLASSFEGEEDDLSLTVMVMKAVAGALRAFPRFNASLNEDATALVLKRYVNLGVAVDTEAGLLVPVVRDTSSKSLRALARELRELSEAARGGKLRREQMRGGTFTLTNVGPIGGTGFTPIVNPPQTAILGLGRARLMPVVRGDLDSHETEVRLMLPLSLSFDHRAIDGAEAARFVRYLCEVLGDADRFVAEV